MVTSIPQMSYDLWESGVPEAGIPATKYIPKKDIPLVAGRVIEYVEHIAAVNGINLGLEHENGMGKDLSSLLMQTTGELVINYGRCWGDPSGEFDSFFPPLRRISLLLETGRDYENVRECMQTVAELYQDQTQIREFVKRNI